MARVSRGTPWLKSATLTDDEYYEPMMIDLPAWWDICKRYTNTTTKHGESRVAAFWMTLITDQTEYCDRPSEQQEGAWFRLWMRSSKLCRLPSTELPVEAAGSLKPTGFKRALWRAMSHRQFFVTGNGSMGLAPAATKVGDVVALFPEATTPFIIRSGADGKYQLIGECYCHGIMYGETLEDRTQWERSLKEIVLR